MFYKSIIANINAAMTYLISKIQIAIYNQKYRFKAAERF